MQRGATAVCLFTFPELVNFEDIEKIKLYIRGTESYTRLEKSSETSEITFVGENVLQACFSQEDTISFFDNENIRMQFHWKNKDGTVKTSKVINTDIYEFLGSEAI